MPSKKKIDENAVNKLLSSFGFFYPRSESELDIFNTLYSNYNYKLSEKSVDPHSILSKMDINPQNNSKVDVPAPPKKPRNYDYYKRLVLVAEIINRFKNEPTLGHIKLQKIIYLCIYYIGLQLPANFKKQAMGPYDSQMMRSIDLQLKRKKWYNYSGSNSLKYLPLENAGEHKKDFQKYFSRYADKIDYILKSTRKLNSKFIEVVVTLYACCKEMQVNSEKLSEQQLIDKFYSWSKEKSKFDKEYVVNVYEWMRSRQIIPK